MTAKRNRKNSNEKKLLFEIYGILTISVAIYVAICLYYKTGSVVPTAIGNVLRGLTGMGSFIIPFFLLLLGLALIARQDHISFKLKFYSLISLFILFLILLEIKISAGINAKNFIQRIQFAYTSGKTNLGGGAIGEIFAYPITKILSKVGAYLFTITFIVINLLILTNASLYKLFQSLKNKSAHIFGKFSESIKDKSDKSEKKEKEPAADNIETAADKDRVKYIDDVNKKIKILDFFRSSQYDNETPEIIDADEGKPEAYDEVKTASAAKPKEEPSKQTAAPLDDINPGSIGNPIKNYEYPPISLLNSPQLSKNSNDKKDLINHAKILEETLESFGVEAKVVQVNRGPVITRFELQPNPGVKVSKIVNLADDIALNLAAPSVRIEAPIPGKAAVGIEVPNKEMSTVTLREIIESKEFKETQSPLTFCLGKDVAGKSIVADLSSMPHLLIAGATGSGKSVCVNALITSILYKSPPSQVRLLMIDPKVVELSSYNGIPHLLIPVVTDPRKAAGALGWAVQEMTNRYKLFADNNVRNIESYNKLMEGESAEKVLPKIIIIIDELADLMMVAPNDVEDCICRLAQMARAAGMHLVVATQRPSVDVLTGVIKANIPSRISFAVSSQIDSRTILDMSGAEKLLGKGDMLFYPVGESKPQRIQGAFVSEKEVEQVVGYIKKKSSSEYKEDIIDEIENKGGDLSEADELLPQAIETVLETGQASISLLQRKMRIGYNRAARLIDSMEERGIIGGYEGSKPRQVLISKKEYEDMFS